MWDEVNLIEELRAGGATARAICARHVHGAWAGRQKTGDLSHRSLSFIAGDIGIIDAEDTPLPNASSTGHRALQKRMGLLGKPGAWWQNLPTAGIIVTEVSASPLWPCF